MIYQNQTGRQRLYCISLNVVILIIVKYVLYDIIKGYYILVFTLISSSVVGIK